MKFLVTRILLMLTSNYQLIVENFICFRQCTTTQFHSTCRHSSEHTTWSSHPPVGQAKEENDLVQPLTVVGAP